MLWPVWPRGPWSRYSNKNSKIRYLRATYLGDEAKVKEIPRSEISHACQLVSASDCLRHPP